MNQQEIAKWNDKVDFNNSTASWIVDIIACLIFFPMIICIAYRRGKYRNKIDPSNALENFNMNSSGRTDKRISQTVKIDEEIHRIAKYMWEYEGKIEAISVNKILITERDYM